MDNIVIAKELCKIANVLIGKGIVADDEEEKIRKWCKAAEGQCAALKSFMFKPNISFSELFGKKTVIFSINLSYDSGIMNRATATKDMGISKMVAFLDRKAQECKKLFPNVQIDW